MNIVATDQDGRQTVIADDVGPGALTYWRGLLRTGELAPEIVEIEQRIGEATDAQTVAMGTQRAQMRKEQRQQ